MTQLNLIPYPQHVTPRDGMFNLTHETRLYAPESLQMIAAEFSSWIEAATSIQLKAGEEQDSGSNHITLRLNKDEQLGAEGYRFEIGTEGIVVEAGEPAGYFYALQTLRQLLPPTPISTPAIYQLPCLTIQDSPRFGWRGIHLDVARHMFPVSYIKQLLDVMAHYKFNTFHWHLTEDQGWRLEIKKYPRLTEIGAHRSATPFPANRKELDGKPYGGFYTQDEVREVVAYATERHITVIPEIELPGHTLGVLASYPEFGCVGEGYEVATYWGIFDDVFCAGNDDVFDFLENVFDELLALFPSKIIHVGGDECPKTRWKECPKCQQRIKEEGLADEYELQSYFIRRIEAYLNSKGRNVVGWDEILEGGLAPNATVMSWRGTEGGIAAANAGHNVVMSPNTHCYFDYYQSEDTDNEPPAIGGYIPLSRAYQFDPVAGVPADKQHFVLGGQANLWSEYIPSTAHADYMLFPRSLAIAESLWFGSNERDFDRFNQRVAAHLPRLAALGVKFREGEAE